ncbi:SDR family NAD(P)-dependent oxidoreductase, partial [Nocardia carnea]|uniref:SDR family NAD(P)-dependent oxidoreductase n=1 Tax=Nocardia carnea TaxID=37328 RepID=UPI002453EA77
MAAPRGGGGGPGEREPPPTGAGSGIGRAFAHELAARGGRIVCADIDEERAAETVASIGRAYPGV